jgi:hypothetical protein
LLSEEEHERNRNTKERTGHHSRPLEDSGGYGKGDS